MLCRKSFHKAESPSPHGDERHSIPSEHRNSYTYEAHQRIHSLCPSLLSSVLVVASCLRDTWYTVWFVECNDLVMLISFLHSISIDSTCRDEQHGFRRWIVRILIIWSQPICCMARSKRQFFFFGVGEKYLWIDSTLETETCAIDSILWLAR